jgi:hypothetical protein
MRPSEFPVSVRRAETAVDSLPPGVREHFARMLANAKAAGHRVRVIESRRSLERQAYLMVRGGGLTFTATSMHASGHAIDVVVGDGNLKSPRTRARWTAFRRWLSAYDRGEVSPHRHAGALLGLAARRAGRQHAGIPVGRGAAPRRAGERVGVL